jgi:hypothetical protein
MVRKTWEALTPPICRKLPPNTKDHNRSPSAPELHKMGTPLPFPPMSLHTTQTLAELSLTQREKNTHTCKFVYRRNTAQCTRSQKKIRRRALLLSYKRNGSERGPVGLILVLRLPQPSLLDLNLYPPWSMKLTVLLSARSPSKELSLSLSLPRYCKLKPNT